MMKQSHIVYIILAFGLIMMMVFPQITNKIYSQNNQAYETESKKTLASTTETVASTSKVADSASNVELAIALPEVKEVVKEEETPKEEEPQQLTLAVVKSYDEMTTEELIEAITNGTYRLEYSNVYDTNTTGLSKAKGALYYNNHKETYYSEKVLPGTSLNIPGRHVADDGTVRDGDGYIAVAANSSYLSKGTVVKTSLGPAKVYDSGCASGTIDLYTNW